MAPNKLGRNFTAAVLNPIWLGHVFSQMPERSSVTNALNWLRSGPNGDRPRTLGGDGTGVKARFGKQALSTMTRAAPPTRARWTGAVTSQSASCCVPTRKLPVSGSSASARQSDAPCVRHSPRWWSRFHRRSRPGPRREPRDVPVAKLTALIFARRPFRDRPERVKQAVVLNRIRSRALR